MKKNAELHLVGQSVQSEPAQESIGIIEVSNTLLQSMLLLPENYEVIGASSALTPHVVNLIVRVTSEQIPAGQQPLPYYVIETIDGKRYNRLDRIEWRTGRREPMTELITLPRWLIDPRDRRLPRPLRDNYRALVYLSMERQSHELTLSEADLERALGWANNMSAMKLRLDALAKRDYLTWYLAGQTRGDRRWHIELTPGMLMVGEESEASQ